MNIGVVRSVANVAAGAYIGGLAVCCGSLYLVYSDADTRQHIPRLLPYTAQWEAATAISKDDVLRSPRYAVKHYRRLLLDMAGAAPEDGSYMVPLVDPQTLRRGPADETNFYLDMVARYATALLAKGEPETLVALLRRVVDDELFFEAGDPERMARCARILARAAPESAVPVLLRSARMLAATFANVSMRDYVLQDGSRASNELLATLDALAAAETQRWRRRLWLGRWRKTELHRALAIYTANLRLVDGLERAAAAGAAAQARTQAQMPLVDCSARALRARAGALRAHIGEVLWALGSRTSAVAWSEDVVAALYHARASDARVGPVLLGVLTNLVAMHTKMGHPAQAQRCAEMRASVQLFEQQTQLWRDSVVLRVSRILHHRGPLGVIEKPLSERFAQPTRVPDIEEYEAEDA